MRPSIRLGTRGSRLALAQAHWVAAALRAAFPDLAIEIVTAHTTGDRRGESLRIIGGQGAFTRELEVALLGGEVDVAVHSLKDLPSRLAAGLTLAAVPVREDVRDVVVYRAQAGEPIRRGGACSGRDGLAGLAPESRVGTGSLRRAAQLLRARPDLRIADVRGNVDTRLRKLDEGQYDALVLAAAGLHRLGLEARIGEYLPTGLLLPAPGQAALGLQCRADDEFSRDVAAAVNDPDTFAAVTAERAFLRAFGAGCQLPIAALGRVIEGPAGAILRLDARVLNHAGTVALEVGDEAPPIEAEALGERAAQQLLARGAAALLER